MVPSVLVYFPLHMMQYFTIKRNRPRGFPGTVAIVYNTHMTHGARGPIIFMALVLLVCAGVFMFTSEQANAPSVGLKPEVSQDEHVIEEAYKNRVMTIETYIGQNIGDLAPVQAVLGGKFFVTEVDAANGKGVAKYEDGHVSYIADFTYTQDSVNGYTITKFKNRK